MRHFLLLLAIPCALALGCSHSSTAPPSNGTTDTTKPKPTYYSIVGQVQEVVLAVSDYDTVQWTPATLDSVSLTGPKTRKAFTGLSGTFFFDSLPAGNYIIAANLTGYVPASLHIPEPDSISSNNVIHAYPQSWIAATIDSVRLDPNTSLGEDVWVHLSSMVRWKKSLGTVFLYLSRNRGIDPKDPSSYDLVFEQIGNQKDSVLELNIEPQLVHSVFPSGTPVFCMAYASPYQGKYVVASYDSTGKQIYPYFGQYPTNTVSFNIP